MQLTYIFEAMSIYLIYSFAGQAGNSIKIYRNALNDVASIKLADNLLLFQHAIPAYISPIIFGLLLNQPIEWYITIVLSAIFHLFFLCPDILDFLVWRKLMYPYKPYEIPANMPWLATNWTHTLAILFSTWSLSDRRCTRFGLVRLSICGYILLFTILYFIV